jgi:D-3-phosphoglycerate dehydrogenase
MKVIVCDGVSREGVKILKEAGFDVMESKKLSEDELASYLTEGYDALIVRSATKVTKNSLRSANALKVIGRAGIGVDNIDVPAATEKGILVMNTPGGSAVTTAEHTIALIFAAARKIPPANASLKDGKWEKSKFLGTELFGKTIGIVGIGNIGSEVAIRAKALGMKVIFYDPYISVEREKILGIQRVDFDELIKTSDIITVHVPLNDETRNLISDEQFSKMKDGVIVVNAARGGIINENALYNALKSGKVAAAALDVFEKEPVAPDHPLLSLENVVVTPHLGASTKEAQENVSVAIAQQITMYLSNGVVRNAVNFPSIAPDIAPFVSLAEKLGSFLSQAFQGQMEEVGIFSFDDIDTRPVRAAAIYGIMKNIMGEAVNILNAEKIAVARGVKIKEGKAEAREFKNILTVTLKMGGIEHKISGTMLEGEVPRVPRIVMIDNLRLEAFPEGNIIFLENEDKPGVLGSVGSLLGEKGINIAHIHLGRDKPGGKAISLINTDEFPPKEVINKLKKLPHIINAVAIKI